MSHGKVVKNASWIIACRIVQAIISFLIGMISARYLGPSNYGLISYAASLVAFAVPIVQLGLRNTLVEEIIGDPAHEGKTLGTTMLLTVMTSILGMGGVMAFSCIANVGEKETILVCLLHSIGLVFQMTEMIQYWFQAKLLSKYTSVVSLIAYAVVSLYKVYLLATEKSIYWFSVTTAFDYLIISAVLLIIYRRLGGQRLSFSWAWAKKLFSKSKYYILSGMMITIFTQTDKIMIKMLVDDAANGFYSVAVTCAGMAGFVFQAIIDSFRPVIFEYKKKSQAAFEQSMTRLYSVILYLGLLQSIFFTVLAPLIISLMYGEAYDPAILLLQVITWYSSFSYMGSVRNIWILAEGQQKYLWLINLSGALLNVVGNAVLIPWIGAVGAAIASVATQFFTNFILSFVMRPIKPTGRLILRSLNPKVLWGMIFRSRKED